MTADAANALAARIWETRESGGRIPRTEADAVAGRDAAYAVQAGAAEVAGLTRAGWKIAATSAIAQDLIGVDGPSLGPVFAEHIQQTPGRAVARPDQNTAIECEIAFVMAGGCDFGPNPTRDAVIAATARAHIAIETVGCRFEGGVKDAGAAILISDFSFADGLVLGPEIENWRDIDMAAIQAAVSQNGIPGNTGAGAAVMGDPVNALVWAAGEAARIGRPLNAGDVITTGTMSGVTPVRPGDTIVGDFGSLGTVEVTFEAG